MIETLTPSETEPLNIPRDLQSLRDLPPEEILPILYKDNAEFTLGPINKETAHERALRHLREKGRRQTHEVNYADLCASVTDESGFDAAKFDALIRVATTTSDIVLIMNEEDMIKALNEQHPWQHGPTPGRSKGVYGTLNYNDIVSSLKIRLAKT